MYFDELPTVNSYPINYCLYLLKWALYILLEIKLIIQLFETKEMMSEISEIKSTEKKYII